MNRCGFTGFDRIYSVGITRLWRRQRALHIYKGTNRKITETIMYRWEFAMWKWDPLKQYGYVTQFAFQWHKSNKQNIINVTRERTL